jgi:hypothetical protein
MDTDVSSMDPNQIALLLLQHLQSGNWRALGAFVVVAVVVAIRKGALHPKLLGRFAFLNWFTTDKGGVALNFIVSSLGGVGNALMAHAPLTVNLMASSAVNACIAAGVFVSVKRLMGRPAETAVPAPADAPKVDPAPKPTDDAAITTTTTTEVPK